MNTVGCHLRNEIYLYLENITRLYDWRIQFDLQITCIWGQLVHSSQICFKIVLVPLTECSIFAISYRIQINIQSMYPTIV